MRRVRNLVEPRVANSRKDLVNLRFSAVELFLDPRNDIVWRVVQDIALVDYPSVLERIVDRVDLGGNSSAVKVDLG